MASAILVSMWLTAPRLHAGQFASGLDSFNRSLQQEMQQPCVQALLAKTGNFRGPALANPALARPLTPPMSAELAQLRQIQPDATEVDVRIYDNQDALDALAQVLEQNRPTDEWYKVPGYAAVAVDQLANNCHGRLSVYWKGSVPKFALEAMARAERQNPGSVELIPVRYSLREEEACMNNLDRLTFHPMRIGSAYIDLSSYGPGLGDGLDASYYRVTKADQQTAGPLPPPRVVAKVLERVCGGMTVRTSVGGPATATW